MGLHTCTAVARSVCICWAFLFSFVTATPLAASQSPNWTRLGFSEKWSIPSLSWLQTIDKVGQLFGRGLVSEDNRANRLMKSLNRDTCHLSKLSLYDCDVKKWQTIRTPTLLCCIIFWLRNNIKSGPYGSAVGHSTVDRQAICWSYISSADCLWKLNHAEVADFRLIWKGLCDFLLVINSNLSSISHRFWDTTAYRLKIANFPYPNSVQP